MTLELSGASDAEIMRIAVAQDRVIISADTDFGELLAKTNATGPSVLLLRQNNGRRAADVVELILANLSQFEQDLENGAVVTIETTRIRVRNLPMYPGG